MEQGRNEILNEGQRVVFVALGSRGDVQPLAVIAQYFATEVLTERSCISVFFATHDELAFLVGSIAPSAKLRPLQAACFLGDSCDLENPICVVDAKGRRRREWVEVCETARDADLLVCNLFAMPPCIHLAEKLGVRLAVCSPCLVPYRLPDSFESDLRHDFPEVYDLITRGGACVTWRDILEWLWPIFTEAHGALREHLLQLPRIPFLPETDGSADGAGIEDSSTAIELPGEHGGGEMRCGGGDQEACIAEAGAHGSSARDDWPAAPLLFVGIDPGLLEAARRVAGAGLPLPSAAQLCGPWDLPPVAPPPEDWPFAEDERPVFLTMGSMGRHGLVDDADTVLRAVVAAAAACGRRVAAQWPAWPAGGFGRAAARVPGDVSYAWAFPRCAAVVHHGGAGTAGECARAGVPQVIYPLAFDQPFWARAVERAGAGAAATAPREIESALRRALAPAAVAAAAAWRRGPGGGEAAVSAALSRALAAGAARNPWREDKAAPLRRPVAVALEGLPAPVLAASAAEAHWMHGEIFAGRAYTPRGILTWPGMTVVDVGACVGLFALYAALRLRARRIVAVEPAAAAAALCARNLAAALGPAAAAVTLHRCACDAAGGGRPADLMSLPGLPSNSCLAAHAAGKAAHLARGGPLNPALADYLLAGGPARETVRCERLADLLPPAAPGEPPGAVSLLKIDVEGGEEGVLLGLGEADWPRIQQVALEAHSDALLAACEALLRPRYARVWHAPAPGVPGHHMLYAAGPRAPARPAAPPEPVPHDPAPAAPLDLL